MKSHRIVPAAVLLCTLAAACGDNPTGTGAQAQPGGASYDGGYTIGSGNSAMQSDSGGFTIGSGLESDGSGGESEASGETTGTSTDGSDDGTERGGYTIGSGN